VGNTARKRKVQIPRRGGKNAMKKPQDRVATVASESVAVGLVALAVFLAFALYSYCTHHYPLFSDTITIPQDIGESDNVMGVTGARIAHVLVSLLGWCAFVTVLWAFLLARRIWVGESRGAGSFLSRVYAVIGSVVMVSSAAAFVTVIVGYKGGGAIGSTAALFLITYVNEAGTLLITFFLFLLSLGIATGIGTGKVLSFFGRVGNFISELVADSWFFSTRVGRVISHAVVTVLSFLAGFGFRFSKGAVVGSGSLVRGVVSRRTEEVDETLSQKPRKRRRRRRARFVEEEPFVLGVEDGEGVERNIKVSRRSALSGSVTSKKKTKKITASKTSRSRHVATQEEARRYDDYEHPSLDLLVAGGDTSLTRGPADEELIKNSRRLEKTLRDFRIGGKVTEVQPGPIITLYHFEPAAGVKVQRIITLADDIALALKVASVRVYAPVPGKGTVGIEVPNEIREVVRLRDVLASPEFNNAESLIELAIGKDTFGDPFVGDLSRMPHLLIAGATGTGKSVCINAILLSLLYRNTPETLRFILIDPKMLELSVYEDIPHLKAPVVTNPKRAKGVLWWAVEEMDQRYKLMKAVGVRNLASYNRAVSSGEAVRRAEQEKETNGVIELGEQDVVATGSGASGGLHQGLSRLDAVEEVDPRVTLTGAEKPLPRIVIVVDELADLMLTVGREIEELLTRLAQKARASGIHLILATQRPSVNVITGLIKANFPSRISFQVASRIDARTVLDSSGAEKLLGQGDMLFLSAGTSRVVRLHGAFVSDKEVQDVVQHLREQGAPEYDEDIEAMIKRMEEAERGGSILVDGDDEYDPLYDQALQLIIEKGVASTSMVQRAFRIGYNRAARILEKMEQDGVVGPQDGSRPREVFAPNREEYLDR